MADLSPFFTPVSVAVLGFDGDSDIDALDMIRSLKHSGFAGTVLPISTTRNTVEGITAKDSLSEIAETPALAVIAAPLHEVPDLLEQVGDHRIDHALIVSSGIGEQKGEGPEIQKRIWEIADTKRITVAGTNSAGVMHMTREGGFAAALFRDLPPGPGPNGGFAVVSQSVTVAEQLLEKGIELSLPISTMVSTGNCLSLGIDDYLDHLAQDPEIVGVMLYFETLADQYRFQEACRRCAIRKPVLAVVGGRSVAGQIAVENKSGGRSLEGDAADQLAEKAGMMRLSSLRTMLIAAKGLSCYPNGIGPNVLILGNTGSAGVLASDTAMAHGLGMPALPPAMAWSLGSDLPDAATADNPVDLLMDASAERFGAALHKAIELAGEDFDAILTIHVAPFRDDPSPVVEMIAACAASCDIPLLHCMLGRLDRKDAWFSQISEAGVPVFDDPEQMVVCAGILSRYEEIRLGLSKPA